MAEEGTTLNPEGTTETGEGEGTQEYGTGQEPQGGEGQPQGGFGEGGGEPQLADLLPDDLKEDEALQGFQSVGELAKKLKELEAQTQGAPEEYELNMEMPDDLPDEVRGAAQEDVEQFKQVAKELGLSNEAAQRLLDYDAQRQANLAETLQQHADNQIQQELEAYKQKRGDAFTEDVNNARAFMQAFSDEETTQWMDESGLGNHPKLIRMLGEAGKLLREHEVIQGNKSAPGASGTSLADRLYSAPPKNKGENSE